MRLSKVSDCRSSARQFQQIVPATTRSIEKAGLAKKWSLNSATPSDTKKLVNYTYDHVSPMLDFACQASSSRLPDDGRVRPAVRCLGEIPDGHKRATAGTCGATLSDNSTFDFVALPTRWTRVFASIPQPLRDKTNSKSRLGSSSRRGNRLQITSRQRLAKQPQVLTPTKRTIPRAPSPIVAAVPDHSRQNARRNHVDRRSQFQAPVLRPCRPSHPQTCRLRKNPGISRRRPTRPSRLRPPLRRARRAKFAWIPQFRWLC